MKPVKLAPMVEALTTGLKIGGTADQEPAAPLAVPAENARPAAGMNILVVEDNLVNQKLAVKLLQRRGDTVTVADDGAMAMEYWQHNRYDCILMDIQMPVMDGITAAKKIREIEARKRGSHADRGHDRPCHEGRPGNLPQCRDGRIHHQADQRPGIVRPVGHHRLRHSGGTPAGFPGRDRLQRKSGPRPVCSISNPSSPTSMEISR